MSRTTLLVAALLGAATWANAAGPADAGPADDALLQAMKDELGRASSSLRLGDLEPPYYLDALVSDQADVEVVATLGALVRSSRDRARPLRVTVRVGSAELDSSEFVATSRSLTRHQGVDVLGLEDEPIALRRDIWLALDAAYKDALERIAAKRATLQNRVVRSPLPDFSRQRPVTSLASRASLDIDVASWEDELRRLSDVFRDYPAIGESSVTLRVQVSNRIFVSSEGIAIRQPFRRAMLLVRAGAQADDGMEVRNFLPVFAADVEELPGEDELARRVRGVADELVALRDAPTLDEYVGPVLFSGQAAGELVAQVLVPELSGHRPPLVEAEGVSALLPRGELASRLNRMVLPPFLSVTDDPTTTSFAGEVLIGSYAFDDQGVAARRLPLVEAGRLKTLLMSRRPTRHIPTSNGHGRAEPTGGVTAHAGNLLLCAAGGVREEDLKRRLLELAGDAGLEHALLVRRIEDGGALSGGRRVSGGASRGGLGGGLADTVLAYRVRVADGREELLRGVRLSGVGVRTLREVVAAGDTPAVANRFDTVSGNMFEAYGGPETDPGVPIAVVTPALLLPDVEASSRGDDQQRPVLLPSPLLSAGRATPAAAPTPPGSARVGGRPAGRAGL